MPATSKEPAVPSLPETAKQTREPRNLAPESLQRFRDIRAQSWEIARPLSAEDCMIQSMEDASPVRWHLAHTTWFFETFLLKDQPDYTPIDPRFESLYNSYYNSVGEQFPRAKRGMISRPNLEETCRYRQHVDNAIEACLSDERFSAEQLGVLEIGLNHEQQHQELMLTDLKHALSQNPLDPVYQTTSFGPAEESAELTWIPFDAGVRSVGHDGDRFCYDNEQPRHRVFLEPFEIANRCVTAGEYLEFIEHGGYERPEFWLSAGWNAVKELGWEAPLYWKKHRNQWTQFTLAGRQPVDENAPVSHVSYFEADAYARWAGARLATEFEWEVAVNAELADTDTTRLTGNWADCRFDESHPIHPLGTKTGEKRGRAGRIEDAFGSVWQWTTSHYSAYPGYRAAEGALGEYNGKFMCGVFVLRGGSCASPSNHIRTTYRNFFAPASRWQFTGIRLSRS
ncbi:MAG: ergothioneine biosynthesis protein EgtB [Planctomycetota bacterium]